MPQAKQTEDTSPPPLKTLIEPLHLVRAIENSFEHSHETQHGITGMHFERYTLIVRKKIGLSWHVECKFRPGKRNPTDGGKR